MRTALTHRKQDCKSLQFQHTGQENEAFQTTDRFHIKSL